MGGLTLKNQMSSVERAMHDTTPPPVSNAHHVSPDGCRYKLVNGPNAIVVGPY